MTLIIQEIFRWSLQLLVAGAAGVLLFGIWRRVAARGRVPALVLGTALLVRAVVATVLWVVLLFSPPFVDRFVNDNGTWFFAGDAYAYVPAATSLSTRGVTGVIFTNRDLLASPSYVQLLALGMVALGRPTQVAVLLNLIAVALSALLICRWTDGVPGASRARNLALVAFCLSPTWILWATQPLKDTVFVSLIVIFFWSLTEWCRYWMMPPAARQASMLAIAWIVLTLSLYLLAGMRWYFAIIVMVAQSVGLVAACFLSQTRARAFAVAFVLFWMELQSVVSGAGAYLPVSMRRVLRQVTHQSAGVRAPSPALPPPSATPLPDRMIQRARQGFEVTPAATSIQRGTALRRLESASPMPEESGLAAGLPASSPVQAPVAANQGKKALPDLPTTIAGRLIAGTTLVFVPVAIAERFGLVRIDGGRGLIWMADFDTVIFDAFLVLIGVVLWRSHARLLANPVVWSLLLTLAVVIAGLTYVVTNFGTLIRLRELILVLGLLLPLAAASSTTHSAPSAGPSTADEPPTVTES